MPIKVDGTNNKIIFYAGAANATTITSALTATPWTLTLPTTAGTAGQALLTDGAGNLYWGAGGGGGGSPAGANTQVQYNSAGAFGANANFTYTSGTNTLALGAAGKLAVSNTAGTFVTTIQAGASTANWTLTLPTTAGTVGQVLATDGFGNTTWTTAAGTAITVTNDIVSGANEFPLSARVTTGNLSAVYTANTDYTYNPSAGNLTAPHMVSSKGIHLNSNIIAASYTLPAGMNGLSAGPMTVPGGVIVTAPAGQAWVVV